MRYSTHLLRHLRFTIGQNISTRRRLNRLPLAKMAELSGIPEHLLIHYKDGKSDIRLNELLKIACILKVDIGDLIAV
jgi:transcriptional regulator with XRE-family HTH domain